MNNRGGRVNHKNQNHRKLCSRANFQSVGENGLITLSNSYAEKVSIQDFRQLKYISGIIFNVNEINYYLWIHNDNMYINSETVYGNGQNRELYYMA